MAPTGEVGEAVTDLPRLSHLSPLPPSPIPAILRGWPVRRSDRLTQQLKSPFSRLTRPLHCNIPVVTPSGGWEIATEDTTYCIPKPLYS